jgi:hypothetical protein
MLSVISAFSAAGSALWDVASLTNLGALRDGFSSFTAHSRDAAVHGGEEKLYGCSLPHELRS